MSTNSLSAGLGDIIEVKYRQAALHYGLETAMAFAPEEAREITVTLSATDGDINAEAVDDIVAALRRLAVSPVGGSNLVVNFQWRPETIKIDPVPPLEFDQELLTSFLAKKLH